MPPATTGNSLSSGLCSHCITDRNLFDKSIAGRTHGSGHGRGLDETQLVMSDIARMHNNSSRQRAKEASRQARRTSSPLCTRPFGHSVVRCRLSVASASAQPTWRPARVSCTRTYRANTTLYHSPFPLLLCPLFLLLSPSPPSLCVSRSRFSQIGELEWFPHTSDRGPAASCSRSEPEPPCRPILCLKDQARGRMRDTFWGSGA
ncbi:hypothetical protein LZ32DRAFT_444733 [Colletotrichum eremochloae]|nr:hypothetical protein LZ32DRAFT_444733 [Colletotrichum eremochloae]